MTINIQNCSNVTVLGHRENGNCKAIYNITTGEIYASVSDAAEIIGVTPASVSQCVLGLTNTCKGMRLCYLSKMTEYIEEITENNRVRYAEARAYNEKKRLFDAIHKIRAIILKRKHNISQYQERIAKYQAKIDALQAEIDNETNLLNEDKTKLDQLYEEV